MLSVFLGSCIYAGTIPIAFWRTAYKWFLVNIYYNIKKELYESIQSIDVDLKFLYLVQNFHVSLFIVYSVNPRVNLIRKQLPFSTHNQYIVVLQCMLNIYLVLAAEQLLHGKFDQVDGWFNGPSTWISHGATVSSAFHVIPVTQSTRYQLVYIYSLKKQMSLIFWCFLLFFSLLFIFFIFIVSSKRRQCLEVEHG